MKKLNRFISLALTLGLALSVMATSVSASKFVDAHGNEVELDDTLEAYSSVVLSGADNAARKAETNLGDLWTDALRWFAVSGKINAYFDEDDVTAGNTKVDVDADHIVALWNGGNLCADIAVGKFGAAEVLLKPAPEGTGVIAGGPVRQVMEAAGIRDIRTKSLRSNNQQNVVTATVEGLKALKCAEDVARTRGKTVDEIQG